jgi:hypothetical protein
MVDLSIVSLAAIHLDPADISVGPWGHTINLPSFLRCVRSKNAIAREQNDDEQACTYLSVARWT